VAFKVFFFNRRYLELKFRWGQNKGVVEELIKDPALDLS